jgi:transposase-like protein
MATRRSRAAWCELVEAWERSGDSIAAFCTRRNLKTKTLSWWRWKLREQKQSTVAPRFVELAVRAPTAPPARASVVELLWNGVVVRFESGTPADYVAAVVSGIRAQ